jgi:thymidylate synthase
VRVLDVANVNVAWWRGVGLLSHEGRLEESRNGQVLVADTPVTTLYQNPCERVLFCPSRDANPFFHLFESMWMLAGSSDARWLDTYVQDFSARFAEPGGHMHGAYGQRWRRNFLHVGILGQSHDQLRTIASMLRADPTTRRAVLTMWDPHRDLGRALRDHPCNTHAYFRVRDGYLDMTVLCRSNDIVWGAYGANAVHMSVLLEWMAAASGHQVGRMYQVSNNFHAYKDVLDPILAKGVTPGNRYFHGEMEPIPLFSGGDPTSVLHELGGWLDDPYNFESVDNPVFRELLVPMARAHTLWRCGTPAVALAALEHVRHQDWRWAAQEWFQRRLARREKSGKGVRSLQLEEQRASETGGSPPGVGA